MIEPLGNMSRGLSRIAGSAAYFIETHGECAVFLSLATRHAYVLTRTDPDWRTAPKRNAAHLVGVYQPIQGRKKLTDWILEDLIAHAASKQGRAAA